VRNLIATRAFARFVTLAVTAVVLRCVPSSAQPMMADLVKVPPVPTAIEAPAGHKVYLKAYAAGTQNYVCLSSGWTFLGPQATLFVTFQWIQGEVRQQIATHFLSPNPSEGGTPRPTWQSSIDTSTVWGKAKASSDDPNYVAAGAIPWLLVEITGSQRGPMSGSLLSQTTFIQRVNTSGGVMPKTACNVGSIALVPYTTDYYFFKAAR
jgi:hypothetical protein